MNCTTFQNQFGEIKIQSQELERLMLSYSQTASPETLHELQVMFDSTSTARDKFFEDYQRGVKELLLQWNWSKYEPSRQEFVNGLEFEEDGRVVANQDLSLYSEEVRHFPSIIRKLNGSLDFGYGRSKITTADYLEEVNGKLTTEHSTLVSAKRLRRVRGTFDGKESSLTNLDSLEAVGGALYLDTNYGLERLDKLRSVGGAFSFDKTSIKRVDSLERIGNWFNMPLVESMASLEYIGSRLSMPENGIEIAKNFYTIFPKLKYIGHFFQPRYQTSIWVFTEEEKEIWEQIKKDGIVQIDGNIVAQSQEERDRKGGAII